MINTNWYLDSIVLLQSKNTNRYQSFSECLRVAPAKIDENKEKLARFFTTRAMLIKLKFYCDRSIITSQEVLNQTYIHLFLHYR